MPGKSKKAILTISILALLLAVVPGPCYALWSIAPVSKERAMELGMEIRSKAAGPDDVRVELELETKGKFKSFSRVELRIGDGEKSLVTATLREDQPKPGRIAVSFVANRDHLDKIFLWVMVEDAVPGGTVYQLRVKDFVDLEKLR